MKSGLMVLLKGVLCLALTFAFLTSPLQASAAVQVLTPSTGSQTKSGRSATIDYSNASHGYIMAKYSGNVKKIKIQITRSGASTYTYDLNNGGRYEVFPLTGGNGAYKVEIYENVSGNQYALACGTGVQVSLANDFYPYLYPSQFVNFSASSAAVKKSDELDGGSEDVLTIVKNVYNYVISNVTYDNDKAAAVSRGGMTGYVPSVDSTLSSNKGICFDYAALMTAMLRCQGIPTRMQLGYVSGGIYHAWISVYSSETGWINDVIYFDGQNWKLMDPTFAASGGGSSSIMEFIGNGSNYRVSFNY